MKAFYFVDMDDVSLKALSVTEDLPPIIVEHIEKTKNERLKEERFLVYSTLIEILSKNLPKRCVSEGFYFDENRKPRLRDESIFFSVSHTKRLALIAVSDAEIGVDIEKIIPEKYESIKKATLKYCSSLSCKKMDTTAMKKSIRSDYIKQEITFEENPLLDDADGNYGFWTRLEAILKCYGKGFKGISDVKEYEKRCFTESFIADYDGEKYAFSICKENK